MKNIQKNMQVCTKKMSLEILKGIKVLDLSSVLAGPSVGMFLAELGADVLKIENPHTKGDITRNWKNPNEHIEQSFSAYYASVNAFKRVEWLDLNYLGVIQKIHDLLKDMDIVLCNFKYQDDKKFQLDYETVRSINERIIYAQISGFGKEHRRVAFDLILQAETGFMYLNREAQQQPNKMPVALIDVLAAHQLKEGILLALYRRLQTGKGAYVHCALYDAAVCSLINQATNYLISQYNPSPMGSKHPNIAPYGEIFETKDKTLITFAIGTDKQFANLCDIVSMAHLANHPLFYSNVERVKHREELYRILQNQIYQLHSDFLYQRCLEKDVPVAMIHDVAQVMKNPLTQRLIKRTKIDEQDVQIITSIAFDII